MNIRETVIKRLKIGMMIGFFFGISPGFSQISNLSPSDLYGSYLEKKASSNQSSTKVISATNQAELDRLERLLEENAASSFEYHLVTYMNGNYDLNLSNHLFEAAKLKPDDARVNRELFGYYAITGNTSKQKEIATTVKGQFSTNTFAYYQQLFSGKSSGFFIFSSDEDAYPALILQSQGKIAAGIKIINMDFLQNDMYRKKIQDQVGGMNMKFLGNEAAFISAIVSSKSSSVYVSTTVSQSYLSKTVGQLYITGLTYESETKNQRQVLESFWKNCQPFLAGLSLTSSSDKALYSNFLPPLLTLYKLKTINGELDAPLEENILLLAKKVGKESIVTTIIKGYEQLE
jgi:hypothetical protein